MFGRTAPTAMRGSDRGPWPDQQHRRRHLEIDLLVRRHQAELAADELERIIKGELVGEIDFAAVYEAVDERRDDGVDIALAPLRDDVRQKRLHEKRSPAQVLRRVHDTEEAAKHPASRAFGDGAGKHRRRLEHLLHCVPAQRRELLEILDQDVRQCAQMTAHVDLVNRGAFAQLGDLGIGIENDTDPEELAERGGRVPGRIVEGLHAQCGRHEARTR